MMITTSARRAIVPLRDDREPAKPPEKRPSGRAARRLKKQLVHREDINGVDRAVLQIMLLSRGRAFTMTPANQSDDLKVSRRVVNGARRDAVASSSASNASRPMTRPSAACSTPVRRSVCGCERSACGLIWRSAQRTAGHTAAPLTSPRCSMSRSVGRRVRSHRLMPGSTCSRSSRFATGGTRTGRNSNSSKMRAPAKPSRRSRFGR
jgi:hypothetical protein